jgi:tetratricopeptide (TPR) repeat protein
MTELQDPAELEDEFGKWIHPDTLDSDEGFDDPDELVYEDAEVNNTRQWELAVENYLPVITNKTNSNQSEESVPGKYTQTEVDFDEAVPLPTFLLAQEEPQVEIKPISLRADVSALEKAEKSRQKEIEVGLARYKWVVQVNPNNAAAWDMLGNLYKSSGQYDDAILAYQQAVNVDPEKTIYLHHLALVYAAVRRDEDAIRTYQKVIQIEPEHGLAHAALGGYFRKMGLEDLAKQHIGKAMRIIYDSENEYNRACLECDQRER